MRSLPGSLSTGRKLPAPSRSLEQGKGVYRSSVKSLGCSLGAVRRRVSDGSRRHFFYGCPAIVSGLRPLAHRCAAFTVLAFAFWWPLVGEDLSSVRFCPSA